MNYCPSCGAPATGTPFCGNCGKPLTAAASPSASASSAAATAGRSAPAATGTWTNPFADIPVSDYVRDAVALVLLLVSLGMPWDLSDTVTGKVYVILVTLLSVVSLALPYLKRGGVLPASWGTAQLRLARLAANVPYVVVVLITVILAYVGEDRGDGVGVGIMFGLAGALLAAQGRRAEQNPDGSGDGGLWRAIASATVLVMVVLTVISLVYFLVDFIDVAEWDALAYVIVAMLFFLALVVVPRLGSLRAEDAAWRDVLVLLGLVALFVGVWQLAADESMADAWGLRDSGPQLLLIPALAVAVSAAGIWAGRGRTVGTHWVAAAARAFVLVAVAEAFGAGLYVVQIVGDETGRGTGITVLVLHLVALLAAVVGRNALVRDAGQGRGVAAVCAVVLVVLGIVIAAVLGGSDLAFIDVVDATMVSMLWWFGVAIALALTVPPSLRAELGPLSAARPAGVGAAAPTGAAAAGQDTATRAAETTPPTNSTQSTVQARADVPAETTPATEWPVPAEDTATPDRSPRDAAGTAGSTVDPGSDRDDAAPVVEPANEAAATRVDMPATFTPQMAADPNTPLQTLADIAAQEPSLRPYVAANPSAYPELLAWLGELGDPAVDEALRRRGR